MKKCKFCLAEIEDGEIRCPACGKDLEEAPQEAPAEEIPAEEIPVEEAPVEEASVEETAPVKKKATPGKIALAVAAIVVLLAMLVGIIFVGMNTPAESEVTLEATEQTVPVETVPATVPADGEKGTITEKGTYTVSDDAVKANKDTVVATMGGKNLTNGQLQVYYWMGYHNFMASNYAYAQYFGLDMSKPLDTQIMDPALHGEDYAMTWQQYFLKLGLESWQQVQAVALEAEAADMKIEDKDQKSLDDLEKTMKESIDAYNVTMDQYFAMNFGPGAGFDEYKKYQEVYYQGAPYYNAETAKLYPSAKELTDYFAEHEEAYASGGITKDTRLVDVRHILLTPENAKEDGTYADEDWAACEKKAQEILDEYLAGETTEDAFAEMAKVFSTDPGSKDNGGLYQNVYQGQMVEPFENWCFDETRKTGDTGLVKTSYGYHIMYYVKAQTDVWKNYATQDWISEKTDELLETAMANHEMEVFYDQISLGNLMQG